MTSFERPTLVRDGVYGHLRRAVLSGEIAPGERLGEVELGERLGVSRTPIREALARLTQDGLLVAEANKGVRVRMVTAAEARDTYVVREELDGLAAALAARKHTPGDAAELRAALHGLTLARGDDDREQTRLDLAFHARVTQAAHNAALADLARGLSLRVTLIKHQTRTYNAHPETEAQHAAILEAILARDAAGARKAARTHVRTFAALVLGDLGRSPPAASGPRPASPAVPPPENSHD